MTDTGRVPDEGQPENAGGQPEQPGAPAPGTYTFASPVEGVASGYEDDLLLPGSHGWGEAPASAQPQAPAPVPGPREPDGYGQHPAPPAQTVQGHAPHTAATPPRPPHLGPPVPEQSGVVRTLADRSSAPAPTPPQGVPVRQPGPPTTGPEYFDVVHEEPAAQAAPSPEAPESVAPAPAAQPGTLPSDPVQPGAWAPQPPPAEPVTAPVRPEAGWPAEPLPGPDLASMPPVPETGEAPAAEAPAPTPAPEAEAAPETETVPEAEAAEPQPQEPAPTPVDETPAPAPAPAPEAEPVPEAEAGAEEPPVAAAPGAVSPAAETGAPEPPVAGPGPQPVHEPREVEPEQPQPAARQEPEPEARRTPGDPENAGEPVAAEAPVDTSAGAAPAAPAPAEPTSGEAASQETAEVPASEPAVTETAPARVPSESSSAGAPAQEPAPAPAEEDPEPAPEQQLAVAAVPGAGPQVMEAVAVTAEPPRQDDAQPPADGGPAVPAAGQEPGTGTPEAAATETDGAQQDAAGTGTAPAAPGYDEAERETLHRLMRERRDIRNGFRSDPIPDDVLLRVLEAAHTAPSVGHSQPWDFVLIRSEETRRTMHELAMRQREAYARSLPRARAKQFKELKVEAILDTPVNIVVTADPTRGGRHTLGRHTQPKMAPYSSALAVENLWLAARAEGLGVGWVSFFDEREMVRVLGLPEHLEVVAYLCIGYVDAFPDEPELVQAGWSKRRPLSWVVHEESYGRRVLPGAEEPHDLLTETLAGIRPLDAKALGEAWERQKRMTKPSGALGMLEIISAQLSGLARQCPPPVPEPAAVAVFAGDHGVHAQGVTAWPQEVTAQMVANFLGGGAVCNAFANQVGAEVCVVDVGVAADLPSAPGLLPRKVRPGTADFTAGPALAREEVLRAVEVGIETARDLVAAGNKALLTGEMGIANTTVSAALIAVFTGADPAEVTGRGTGVSDEMHARKVEVVRRALELHRPDASDPLGVLAAVGGLEHAALTGLILGGASLRTPVVLDGVSAGAAALVARAIAPEALAACIAGHRSAEPGHVAALTKLGLRPLIDLDLRLGEGTGALLALPVVQSAARAMHEVATFDSAGVTEKD
ncbi:nicotinate-nucleotide--dimethylbenzimidazole phosphoribosyltransferase [Streptomyces verrucosisporus]|uniref:nicotinate-nucleotide--dimethylbenzimidazole phosphoribosyltransferase n=1 Tax=Streptomyces verrucosisporus TaxID=1695161 RepID=UPI0019D0C6A7|nr:nicotinate-nucleotide--dimethylbenzimidazole phosphoribosyltransferase [Streptomyces verrucosisporus]MBN3930053.1 nicotinate-nucleotide--dimethylbenzimidazole phosphoribosyltransferase [Streptomyces verrucosisporus]